MIEGHGMDSLAFRFRLGRVFVLAVFLFLYSGVSWAVCSNSSLGNIVTGCGCKNIKCPTSTSGNCRLPECGSSENTTVNVPEGCTEQGETQCDVSSCGLRSVNGFNCWGAISSIPMVCCTDQCEADSVACKSQGGTWVPSDDPDECGYCDDDTTDVCADFRRQCEGAGGHFSGTEYNTSSRKCCSASCNLCNNESAEKIRTQKTKECCSQNKAPPDPLQQCFTPLQSGCGMTSSYYSDSNNEWACRDPNQSKEAYNAFYRECGNSSSSENSSDSECEGDNCEGPNSSDSQSSSSNEEGPNSSEDVGPNSSTDGLGCEECQLLDEAIDTLHLIHQSIDGIYNCLSSPYLCTSNKVDDSNDPFQFDTAFRRYLRPLMDSMLKVDSNQLKALVRLDTNTLKMLRNDTTTRTVIEGGFSSLEDTTRKWFKRIADSIGVSTSELASHIDSIIRHIPDSVLDSIVKYQQYATDNFDSVLYGHGKGFSLVDSLIDSAVRYFQLSHHYDSMYNLMFRDSLGSINQSVDGLPIATAGAVNSVFGYGDTASSTLRGDLDGIRGAIEGLGDGLGGDIAGALDSAWGNGTAAEGSGFEDYGTDSAGYAGVLDSYYSEGTTVDSAYLVDGDTCTTVDCIVSNVNYNVDSMGEAFKASLDTQYRSLSDSSSVWFDSIKKNLMFVDFDSVLVNPLRQRIPNTNTCPENCFSFDVASGAIPGVNKITYPICKNFTIGGITTNGLLIVRLILRILTAMGCIYIGLWFIAGKKG